MNFEEQTGCFAVILGEVIAGFGCSLVENFSHVIINLAGSFLLGFLLRLLPLFIWVRGAGWNGRASEEKEA